MAHFGFLNDLADPLERTLMWISGHSRAPELASLPKLDFAIVLTSLSSVALVHKIGLKLHYMFPAHICLGCS